VRALKYKHKMRYAKGRATHYSVFNLTRGQRISACNGVPAWHRNNAYTVADEEPVTCKLCLKLSPKEFGNGLDKSDRG
jgi:hypothetical protein